MGVVSLSEYLDTSERSGGKKMAAILGRNLSVTLDLGDGREYKLDSGMITNIEISNTVDDVARFGIDIVGSPIRSRPVQSNVTLTGVYEGKGLDELFAYAGLHLAPAAYASHTIPFEIFLLAMLLEEHKEVMRLRRVVGELLGNDRDTDT